MVKWKLEQIESELKKKCKRSYNSLKKERLKWTQIVYSKLWYSSNQMIVEIRTEIKVHQKADLPVKE